MAENTLENSAWLYDIDNRDVYTDDIPFYVEYAKKQNGEVLELGCGTGRVAIPIAKAGLYVTGLDLSTQMLDVFREKLAASPGLADRITLVHGNMADFCFGRKFPLIIVPFRAFLCLTKERDIENSLVCVREHLTDDGLFVVDVFNTRPNMDNWCHGEEIQWEKFDEKSGRHVVKKVGQDKIDRENQIIYLHFAFEVTYPDKRTERIVDELKLKYYYNAQLRAHVEKAGMEVAEEYSWYDKTPPGGREIIFVCRRKRK